MRRPTRTHLTTLVLAASLALAGATTAYASGGGGGGGTTAAPAPSATVDTIKVTKAYTNATPESGGELLIKASSSDSSARLFAYRPDGTLIGEVQNGGGSRYGGTVMPYQFAYSASVTIRSSAGGAITVPTTPFQI